MFFSIWNYHKCLYRVSSFWFIWIPMLYIYILINSFSAGTVFRRHNLTSSDVRLWRLKTVPALIGLIVFCSVFVLSGSDMEWRRIEQSTGDRSHGCRGWSGLECGVVLYAVRHTGRLPPGSHCVVYDLCQRYVCLQLVRYSGRTEKHPACGMSLSGCHYALNKCCFIVGTASQTLVQPSPHYVCEKL